MDVEELQVGQLVRVGPGVRGTVVEVDHQLHVVRVALNGGRDESWYLVDDLAPVEPWGRERRRAG
jgi:hypothetical protein